VDLVSPYKSTSSYFIIQPGKQVTLYATGLTGDDKVYIELLHLSRAPDFVGNVCCDALPPNIQILGTTVLKCSDRNEAVMTAEYPFFVLDTPQNVPLRVRVDADPSAQVTVELQETESDGCMACTCRCYDEVWTDTGQVRCENWVIEREQRSNCGTLRWNPTTKTCYCPSLPLSCDGQAGYGFHEMDPKDPAATVEMAPCPGDTSTDSIWIYPTAGEGHTIKVVECDGTVIGYAANCSNCACQ